MGVHAGLFVSLGRVSVPEESMSVHVSLCAFVFSLHVCTLRLRESVDIYPFIS